MDAYYVQLSYHPTTLFFSPNALGVDFTNVFAHILRVRFSYERLFSSYVLRKTLAKNVGEIDPRSPFQIGRG